MSFELIDNKGIYTSQEARIYELKAIGSDGEILYKYPVDEKPFDNGGEIIKFNRDGTSTFIPISSIEGGLPDPVPELNIVKLNIVDTDGELFYTLPEVKPTEENSIIIINQDGTSDLVPFNLQTAYACYGVSGRVMTPNQSVLFNFSSIQKQVNVSLESGNNRNIVISKSGDYNINILFQTSAAVAQQSMTATLLKNGQYIADDLNLLITPPIQTTYSNNLISIISLVQGDILQLRGITGNNGNLTVGGISIILSLL
jgi:hypothetical protein